MARKPVQLDAKGYRKFGMRDKVAYAAGDLGCNMSFALKGTVQTFWLVYMMLETGLLSILLLVVQIWDAVNDPLIGSMIDRDNRHYKRGKFKQYIFIGSCGLLVGGAAVFLPFPNAPVVIKAALFILGYIIWDAFYTVANVPYGSLLSLISDNAGDRASLSAFRSVGSMVGNMVPMMILPLIIYDAEDNLIGERVFIAALIMGFLGFLCFQYMIKNTVVRVEQEVKCNDEGDAPKFNIFKSFGSFFKNRAAVGATLAPVGMFIGMYGAQYANTAMYQSYFHNAQISGIMGLISYIPMFFFMPFASKIAMKVGKKEGSAIGATISLIGYALLLILPITPDTKGMAMWVVGMAIAGCGGGFYQAISWSLMADAMDYGEWKFGVREEGTTYALHSFFRKLAQGIGPSCGLLLAGALGFVEANKGNQTFEVAQNMRWLAAGAYCVSGLIMFIGLALVYNLDKKTLAKIDADLKARKAAK